MIKHSKYLIEKFEEHLNDKYTSYCKMHGDKPTTNGLLAFLIEHDFIPARAIKKFAVMEEFDKINRKDRFTKSQKINVIADLFEIPERTIWGILKGGQQENFKE